MPQYERVKQLLESAALPASDLTNEHMQDFFFIGEADAPVAIVGVQFVGSDALLRSLWVAGSHRAQGLGRTLVEHAERHAREGGATHVYLLTTTAESFFRSRGYGVASRESAPPAIRSTPEFAGLCPASSAFLTKHL
ncbi:MAG: arsenic resistance N-acetyltransferase ArsN2 [Pseudomonadota bacterium]|nr:arsenic resistance N-acetyltransferase ArsN2 [Pseudomonadota bacterium]